MSTTSNISGGMVVGRATTGANAGQLLTFNTNGTVGPYIYPTGVSSRAVTTTQGMSVQFSTVENLDGFRGQIRIQIGSVSALVWESKHPYTFTDYEDADGDPKVQAQKAALESAHAHAEHVLRSLFNKR